MNRTRTKWIRMLCGSQNPILLTMIRNKFGEKTKEMGPRQIYQSAKKLWNRGELQKVTGWPTMQQLKNMAKLPMDLMN